jgi:hypothetical protein
VEPHNAVIPPESFRDRESFLRTPEGLQIPKAFGTMTEISKECGFSFGLVCKIFFFLLFAFQIIFLAAGCNREPDVKKPNTITVGFLAAAKRLLPLLASDSASGEISGLIYNGLTKYDKDIRVTWLSRGTFLRMVFR